MHLDVDAPEAVQRDRQDPSSDPLSPMPFDGDSFAWPPDQLVPEANSGTGPIDERLGTSAING